MPSLVICTEETEYFSTSIYILRKRFWKTILYKSLFNTLVRIKLCRKKHTTARLRITYETCNIISIRGSSGILLSICGKFIHIMANWSIFFCYSLVERWLYVVKFGVIVKKCGRRNFVGYINGIQVPKLGGEV